MRFVILLVMFFTEVSICFASPASLSKEQESKILFMLLENQNRKTVTKDRKETCNKKQPNTWFCSNNTVKKFLIGALGTNLDVGHYRSHQVSCEQITAENRKTMNESVTTGLSSEDLRREVSLALPGQWVCSYKFLNNEKKAESEVSTTAEVSKIQTSGISFLMNRDLNRIISRHIVVWNQNI